MYFYVLFKKNNKSERDYDLWVYVCKVKKIYVVFLIKVFVYKMRYIYSLKLFSLSYLNMFKNAENYLVASWEVFLVVVFLCWHCAAEAISMK